MNRMALSSPALTDEEVIARVLNGEKELYELIMRRYNQRLYKICRAYVQDGDEAEDIVQETHIRAYQGLPGFQARSQFSTWLTRILINEALGRTRRSKRYVRMQSRPSGNGEGREIADSAASTTNNPLGIVMNSELRTILEQAVDRLPEKYRIVYLMREVEGMSVAETSACLKISETNVKVRLNRAKEFLRKDIGNVYGGAMVYHFDLVRCDRIVDHVMKRIQRYSTPT